VYHSAEFPFMKNERTFPRSPGRWYGRRRPCHRTGRRADEAQHDRPFAVELFTDERRDVVAGYLGEVDQDVNEKLFATPKP